MFFLLFHSLYLDTWVAMHKYFESRITKVKSTSSVDSKPPSLKKAWELGQIDRNQSLHLVNEGQTEFKFRHPAVKEFCFIIFFTVFLDGIVVSVRLLNHPHCDFRYVIA